MNRSIPAIVTVLVWTTYGMAVITPSGSDAHHVVPGERSFGIDLDGVALIAGIEQLVYDFDSGLQEHNTLAGLGIQSDLGFAENEVFAARGDSGGPAFRMDGSIAGIVAFGGRLDDAPDESFGAVAFDIPVASFQDFISTATNGSAVFVPEPATLRTIVLGVFWIPGRSRRQPRFRDSL